ncbi:Ig-like domain-containing protein, partial [Mesorhizobium sp.]|uniref:Ig-like domain-containing protein n=1 Tax=Mesorhizobium sp. TaxID=1871066 RepID=UPI0011FE2BB5
MAINSSKAFLFAAGGVAVVAAVAYGSGALDPYINKQNPPPTFDVVRVEGNGSIVVAGSAAPNAKVEVLNGGTVLGSTDAGPDGAFAIVLDDPLKPGDYTITLRSTAG